MKRLTSVFLFFCVELFFAQKNDTTKIILEVNYRDKYTNESISNINFKVYKDSNLILNRTKHDTLPFNTTVEKGFNYNIIVSPSFCYPQVKESIKRLKTDSIQKFIFEIYNIPRTHCNENKVDFNFHFQNSESNLNIFQKVKLDSINEWIFKKFPDIIIQIEGNRSFLENESCSLKRAEAVAIYLESIGIKKEQLIIFDYKTNNLDSIREVFDLFTKEAQRNTILDNQSVEFKVISFGN